MVYTFVVAAVLITLAELGDKTQLLVLGLATRYKAWQVLTGVVIASLAVHFIAAGVGTVIGDLIPDSVIAVVAGLVFIGFGIWTLRGGVKDEEEGLRSPSRSGPILTVALAFFVAELGDKTQVMAATVAADPAAVLRTMGAVGPAITGALESMGLSPQGVSGTPAFLGVWLGSVLGMVLADGVAVLAGAAIGKRLPTTLVARISGAVFILFGIATLVSVAFT